MTCLKSILSNVSTYTNLLYQLHPQKVQNTKQMINSTCMYSARTRLVHVYFYIYYTRALVKIAVNKIIN